jgi:prepilin-type N-terminal cleavage/methylation domain-containing protein
MSQYMEKRNEKGFTLIELLIAIVVVGILAAVAIVGIAGLTNTGGKSACVATEDATKAASAAFYANNNAWPTSFAQLTTVSASAPVNSPAVLEKPANVTVAGGVMQNPGSWTLTGTFSAAATPDFTSAGMGCTSP